VNYTRGKRGFGGNAPNKLMASAEGEGSELASDPCRRHGQKLVPYLSHSAWKRKEGLVIAYVRMSVAANKTLLGQHWSATGPP
jgi:hypothetical protein